MMVIRLYTTSEHHGFRALFGEMPDEALRLRSGAALFIHMKENKIFTGTSGEELYQKVKANKYLEGEEILHFKLDFQAKMLEAKEIDWKE